VNGVKSTHFEGGSPLFRGQFQPANRPSKTAKVELTTTTGTGFSGGFELNEGLLRISGSGNRPLGTGTFTISGGTISGDGFTGLTMPSRFGGNFSVGGASAVNLGSGTVTLAATPTVDVVNSAVTFTIGGPIVGENTSFGLTKNGPGQLTLNGTNTYAGTTRVNSGTISLGNALGLQNSGLDTDGSGKIVYTTSTNSITLGGLAGSSNLGTVIAFGFASGTSLTLNPQAGNSYSYSGVIANFGTNLALTKTGAGEQILSGLNTYTGLTTVSAGRLTIASGSINTSSGVTVNGVGAEFRYNSATALNQPLTLTQGILSGTGTINTAVTVGSNATISPGNSPGSQTYTSSQWQAGGTYLWELNAMTGAAGTNWDKVVVTNLLDLTGLSASNKFNINLTTLTGSDTNGPLNSPYVSGPTYIFPFVDFGSLAVPAGFTSGSNSDLTALFNFDLTNWVGISGSSKPQAKDISVKVNSGGTGLNLVIVPEPATIALAGIGIGTAVWFFRRRRAA